MFQFGVVLDYADLFLTGAVYTLLMGLIAIIGSFSLAIPGVAARMARARPVNAFAKGYVHLFRNTPLLVLLYVLFFGVGSLGLRLSPFWAGAVGVMLNSTAYTIEIYRGGIMAIPAGQREAANALGFNAVQRWRYVILPQALRTAFYPLGNQVIQVLLGTSVALAIAGPELTSATYSVGAFTYRYFESFCVAAVIYFVLVQVISTGWRVFGSVALPSYQR